MVVDSDERKSLRQANLLMVDVNAHLENSAGDQRLRKSNSTWTQSRLLEEPSDSSCIIAREALREEHMVGAEEPTKCRPKLFRAPMHLQASNRVVLGRQGNHMFNFPLSKLQVNSENTTTIPTSSAQGRFIR